MVMSEMDKFGQFLFVHRVLPPSSHLGGHARSDSGARDGVPSGNLPRPHFRLRLALLVPLAEMSTERALQRKRAELESVEHALGTTFQRIAVGSRRLEALSHMDRAAEAWLAACIPGTEHHAEAFAAHHSSCRAALKQVRPSSLLRPSRAGIRRADPTFPNAHPRPPVALVPAGGGIRHERAREAREVRRDAQASLSRVPEALEPSSPT